MMTTISTSKSLYDMQIHTVGTTRSARVALRFVIAVEMLGLSAKTAAILRCHRNLTP
jgi:hypothetical protein